MMLVPGAVTATSSQATLLYYATQAVNFSEYKSPHLHGKCPCQDIKLQDKCVIFGNHNFLASATQRWITASKNLVFALPSDSKGAQRVGSSNPIDDAGVNRPEVVSASLLQSGMEIIHGADEHGTQENLLDKMKAISLHVLAMEQWNASRLKACRRKYMESAINLIHYLALKSLDLVKLEREFFSLGLLNLKATNPHVLASLSVAIRTLEKLENATLTNTRFAGEMDSISRSLGKELKAEFTLSKMKKRVSSNSNLLFGTSQGKKTKHIMVTVGQEAAENQTLVKDLINAGATVFRINCAHGNAGIWTEIVKKIKENSHVLEKPCRILMDLAGPKLRTGKFKDGPSVVKISPKKDSFGNVLHPAKVWLALQGTGHPPSHVSVDTVLYVEGQKLLRRLEVNDVVRFTDARGKRRTLKITSKVPCFSTVGFVAECIKTAYVESGTKLYTKDKRQRSSVGFVVDVPPVEQFVRLKVGDLLIISQDGSQENAVPVSSSGSTHRITCSSGYLFDSVKPGEPIAFDDGKVWGVIKGASTSEIVVSITRAGPKGTKLGSDKSINIPESDMRYEGLTSKDIMDLDFVASHADMVGVSFLRDVKDVVLLRQELAKRSIWEKGVVLKIETKGGFEKLPFLILEAMKSPNPLGIMIARGDLAVECGWENLAEMQEEIVSICEAAHVPVIWATQVLESLVRSGVPTRAEITDVSVANRTSCVMLNKGKHIVEAVEALDSMLNAQPPKSGAGT